MYLRANYAYYLSNLVPSLLDKDEEVILPVMIRLNDFQHITEPQEIYRQIIIKVVGELTNLYKHLEDAKSLLKIQQNIKNLPEKLMRISKNYEMMQKISKLSSEEYLEKISTDKKAAGSLKASFIEASSEWKNNKSHEFKIKPNPGIKDIEECYKYLLGKGEGKILLLIDEAGALDKSFFKAEQDKPCFFEVLMNQFRTSHFIKTKVAIYPNSFSDMLTETRYGDVIRLEDNVYEKQDYINLRKKAINIIQNYINPKGDPDFPFKASDVFEIYEGDEAYGDSLEMILYASDGNMRRLIHLFDMSMDSAYIEKNFAQQVNKNHAINAIIRHAANNEATLPPADKVFLNDIVSLCKGRAAFKFTFPNVPLYKFTNRSREYNLVNIEVPGAGRAPTIYSLDFSYCVYKEVPTHRTSDDDKIYKERSCDHGKWSNRKATITQDLLAQASIPGKVDGTIVFLVNEAGFIKSEGSDVEAYFTFKDIVEADKGKIVHTGQKVRYFPYDSDNKHVLAALVEIL